MTAFTTAEVAKILELPAARIRSWVRAGFVAPSRGPSGRIAFSFQDLLVLRTTKDLLDADVPPRRLRRLLTSLRRQLPADQNLASVTIYADGRRVVAWDGTARWQPDSGQFLLHFDADAVARKAAAKPAARAGSRRAGAPLSAAHWLQIASELETASPEEAQQAYHQALELEPANVEAHVNLGRLYHDARDYPRAEAHYRAAARHAPRDPVPHYNLGVLLEDRGRRAEAIQAYRTALERDPEFADAHYNLGLLYDAMGRRAQAITHLRTARKLYDRTARAR
ncbi:MAG: tetratricopeptide repeat protein [Armatimonadota bacterium]|nr:tetratricopeptide repeat protein [Armatimonadota bacterium]MDR7453132.1 tetratricopeptide repeat protein [Armatimonadota bacterium]MDR7456128.1 tetratricopeptide repeat protein [Armatimonadota bacterium]MDR7497850.1 tetratricopeptide repeat protein [Armatimonadota bacterium]MDR7511370.1 tetratricopeptide repeat protein [Armatimonadota bacterium]